MRRNLKYSGFAAAAVMSLLCGGIVIGLGGSPVPAGASGRPLIMESSPESTITQDFNPFVPTASPQGMGATGLIYEPLIQFDLAKPPRYYPWLATHYKWSNGGKAITFTIRKGVKWNDGKPLTPADVAFTFNLVKANAAINLTGLNITGVKTAGDAVTVSFPTAQYTNIENIGGEAILPKAIWSKAGNPALFSDPNPVGTGPMMLGTFASNGFTLKRNPFFWKKSSVHVPEVEFPQYTTNDGAATALFAGQIDWTGNFIVGLQKDFVAPNPKYHHYWENPNGTNSFEPNLTKWPTNQLAVRQAMSLAIDRSVLAQEGEAGLQYPVLSQTGLTLPTFGAWEARAIRGLVNSPHAQTADARQVLQKAGYKLNGSGWFAKGGKVVSVTLIAPSAYSDYALVGALAAGEMRKAGIDATFKGLTVNGWNAALATGNFSVSEHWSNGGLTPYNEFDGWLNSALASGASANAATGDYERLHNPTMDADLARLEGAPDLAAQTRDLLPLEMYIAQHTVLIPTTTGSAWFEYNDQYYKGFPTQANPYDSGQPSGTNNGPGSGTDEVVLLHLRPR